MKRPNQTISLLIFSLACAFAVGGVYIFFFTSMKNKAEASVDLSTRLSELLGEQLRYSSAAPALQNESDNINKLSSYFIKESEIVSFTKKIEALGPQAGAMLTIESLDPGMGSGNVPYLSFRLTGEGKFENVEYLLSLLQNFPGKFEWRSVHLTHNSMGKWKIDATLVALNFIKG